VGFLRQLDVALGDVFKINENWHVSIYLRVGDYQRDLLWSGVKDQAIGEAISRIRERAVRAVVEDFVNGLPGEKK
jgi:hypothetical protein